MYILESLNEYLEEVAATNSYYDATLSGDGYYQPISSYEELKCKRYSYKSRKFNDKKNNN